MVTVLRYHEAVLRILEQDKPFDGDKIKGGLDRQEAWIKTLDHIVVPDTWDDNTGRYYCKLYCCNLLQRSLQLYTKTAGQKLGHLSDSDMHKASWPILYKIITLAELIRSLEQVYQHFDTINDTLVKL